MDLLIGICVGILGIYDVSKNYKKTAKRKLEVGQKTDIIEDYFISFFLLVLSILLISGKFSITELFVK